MCGFRSKCDDVHKNGLTSPRRLTIQYIPILVSWLERNRRESRGDKHAVQIAILANFAVITPGSPYGSPRMSRQQSVEHDLLNKPPYRDKAEWRVAVFVPSARAYELRWLVHACFSLTLLSHYGLVISVFRESKPRMVSSSGSTGPGVREPCRHRAC